MQPCRTALLVQLPIPPVGPGPLRGNVPLAAGYLALHARRTGRSAGVALDIFPPMLANALGDAALVDAIVARRPDLVGFTCYLWNIDRTLWVAARLRERLPGVKIVIGGPEITTDNAWVLDAEAVDWFAIGEGEQTFAELLAWWASGARGAPSAIAGLAHRVDGKIVMNARRTPLPDIGVISSPYLDGILDAADSETLLLETSRGCIFKCKFCYYPKAYDTQYFLSPDLVLQNLAHARARGAREVFLLDPTLNQRPDFGAFVDLLAQGNPDRTLEYHAELRGEGITPKIAAAMQRANFAEVEIGLQSTDPHTQELMERRNNLRAFENGVRALRDCGIKVKVDMIVGLPGDTVETVRRGMSFLAEKELVDDVQVFQLSILPGTSFRKEAADLGLVHQERPPYYTLRTPTLDVDAMCGLLEEAEEIFTTQFDPVPEPWLERAEPAATGGAPSWHVVDLDGDATPPPRDAAQVFTLVLKARDPFERLDAMTASVRAFLRANPFTTLQTVIETGEPFPFDVLDALRDACTVRENVYLERFHEFSPARTNPARRIVVALDAAHADADWVDAAREVADVVVLAPRT